MSQRENVIGFNMFSFSGFIFGIAIRDDGSPSANILGGIICATPKSKSFSYFVISSQLFYSHNTVGDRVRLCSNHIEKTINVIWWSLTGGRTGKSWTFARQLGDFWSHPPPTAPRLLRCPHLSLTWGIRPISRRKRLLGFSRRRPPPPSYHLRMLPPPLMQNMQQICRK